MFSLDKSGAIYSEPVIVGKKKPKHKKISALPKKRAVITMANRKKKSKVGKRGSLQIHEGIDDQGNYYVRI